MCTLLSAYAVCFVVPILNILMIMKHIIVLLKLEFYKFMIYEKAPPQHKKAMCHWHAYSQP